MSLRHYYAHESMQPRPQGLQEGPRDEVGEQGERAREVKLKYLWPLSISLS